MLYYVYINEWDTFHIRQPFPNSQGVALVKLASGPLLPVKRSNCGAWVVGRDRTGIERVAFFKLIFESCDFLLKSTCNSLQTLYNSSCKLVKESKHKGRYKNMNEFYKIMRVFKNGETATDVLPSDKAKCLVGNSMIFRDGSEPNYIYVYEVAGNSPIMSVDTATSCINALPGDQFQASVKDYVSKF